MSRRRRGAGRGARRGGRARAAGRGPRRAGARKFGSLLACLARIPAAVLDGHLAGLLLLLPQGLCVRAHLVGARVPMLRDGLDVLPAVAVDPPKAGAPRASSSAAASSRPRRRRHRRRRRLRGPAWGRGWRASVEGPAGGGARSGRAGVRDGAGEAPGAKCGRTGRTAPTRCAALDRRTLVRSRSISPHVALQLGPRAAR